MPSTNPTYKAREFALIAGVTVRALHHYDRIGLLKPRRTAAGHRVYSDRGLVVLEVRAASGRPVNQETFRRISEVIEMQNNSDALTREYDDLVRQKIDRLQSLSPQTMADLRGQWNTLVAEIRGIVTEDQASPAAQELGARWTNLLATLMGQPVDPTRLAVHQQQEEWNPRMASFVDKPVWDFITRVLSART